MSPNRRSKSSEFEITSIDLESKNNISNLKSSNNVALQGHQHVIHPFPSDSKLSPGTHFLLADKDTKIDLIFQRCKHSCQETCWNLEHPNSQTGTKPSAGTWQNAKCIHKNHRKATPSFSFRTFLSCAADSANSAAQHSPASQVVLWFPYGSLMFHGIVASLAFSSMMKVFNFSFLFDQIDEISVATCGPKIDS